MIHQKDPSMNQDEADRIYLAYPKRIARINAIKAIQALLRAGVDSTHLFDRAAAYAEAVARWPAADRAKYVPHPATWFNRGSFDDDPATWERNAEKSESFPSGAQFVSNPMIFK